MEQQQQQQQQQQKSELPKSRFIDYFSLLFLYGDFIRLFAQELNLKQSDTSIFGYKDGYITFLEGFEGICERELGRGQ